MKKLFNKFQEPKAKALRICQETGKVEKLHALLIRNPDLDLKRIRFDGWTALHLAILNGHYELAEFLITRVKLDVNATKEANIQPSATFTPMHEVDPLLNDLGCTVLHMACWFGCLNILNLLIEKRVNINARTTGGYTSLHFACRNGHQSIVQLLIRSSIDVTLRSKEGFTTLIMACKNNKLDMVTYLIESQQIDVDESDYAGFTALHHSTLQGYVSIVEYLLFAGANPLQVNKQGRKPVDISPTAELRSILTAAMKSHESSTNIIEPSTLPSGEVDERMSNMLKVISKATPPPSPSISVSSQMNNISPQNSVKSIKRDSQTNATATTATAVSLSSHNGIAIPSTFPNIDSDTTTTSNDNNNNNNNNTVMDRKLPPVTSDSYSITDNESNKNPLSIDFPLDSSGGVTNRDNSTKKLVGSVHTGQTGPSSSSSSSLISQSNDAELHDFYPSLESSTDDFVMSNPMATSSSSIAAVSKNNIPKVPKPANTNTSLPTTTTVTTKPIDGVSSGDTNSYSNVTANRSTLPKNIMKLIDTTDSASSTAAHDRPSRPMTMGGTGKTVVADSKQSTNIAQLIEQERVKLENERKAEEERVKLENERKAEEERVKLENERKAEVERVKLENERKAEVERVKLENERKAEEERVKLENERKAEVERVKLENERKAEVERVKLENERKAEEERVKLENERKAEEERVKLENERKAEEERVKLENERKAEEERVKLENERKAEEERVKLENERKAEEERVRKASKQSVLSVDIDASGLGSTTTTTSSSSLSPLPLSEIDVRSVVVSQVIESINSRTTPTNPIFPPSPPTVSYLNTTSKPSPYPENANTTSTTTVTSSTGVASPSRKEPTIITNQLPVVVESNKVATSSEIVADTTSSVALVSTATSTTAAVSSPSPRVSSALPSAIVALFWSIVKDTGDTSALLDLLGRVSEAHQSALISLRDADHWTPLMRSSYVGFYSIVETLLKYGANVHDVDRNGNTSLHRSCWAGHLDVAKLLKKYGADIEALNEDMCTPLHRAAANGQVSLLEYLVVQGANVEAQDLDEYTPLHMACHFGHEEVVRILVKEANAYVDAVTKYGESTSELAKTAAIRALLEGERGNSLLVMSVELKEYDAATAVATMDDVSNNKVNSLLLQQQEVVANTEVSSNHKQDVEELEEDDEEEDDEEEVLSVTSAASADAILMRVLDSDGNIDTSGNIPRPSPLSPRPASTPPRLNYYRTEPSITVPQDGDTTKPITSLLDPSVKVTLIAPTAVKQLPLPLLPPSTTPASARVQVPPGAMTPQLKAPKRLISEEEMMVDSDGEEEEEEEEEPPEYPEDDEPLIPSPSTSSIVFTENGRKLNFPVSSLEAVYGSPVHTSLDADGSLRITRVIPPYKGPLPVEAPRPSGNDLLLGNITLSAEDFPYPYPFPVLGGEGESAMNTTDTNDDNKLYTLALSPRSSNIPKMSVNNGGSGSSISVNRPPLTELAVSWLRLVGAVCRACGRTGFQAMLRRFYHWKYSDVGGMEAVGGFPEALSDDASMPSIKGTSTSSPARLPEITAAQAKAALRQLGMLPEVIKPLLKNNEGVLWTIFSHYCSHKQEIPSPSVPNSRRYLKKLLTHDEVWSLLRDFGLCPELCGRAKLREILVEVGCVLPPEKNSGRSSIGVVTSLTHKGNNNNHDKMIVVPPTDYVSAAAASYFRGVRGLRGTSMTMNSSTLPSTTNTDMNTSGGGGGAGGDKNKTYSLSHSTTGITSSSSSSAPIKPVTLPILSFKGFMKVLWLLTVECLEAPPATEAIVRFCMLLRRMDSSPGRVKMANQARDFKLLGPFHLLNDTNSSSILFSPTTTTTTTTTSNHELFKSTTTTTTSASATSSPSLVPPVTTTTPTTATTATTIAIVPDSSVRSLSSLLQEEVKAEAVVVVSETTVTMADQLLPPVVILQSQVIPSHEEDTSVTVLDVSVSSVKSHNNRSDIISSSDNSMNKSSSSLLPTKKNESKSKSSKSSTATHKDIMPIPTYTPTSTSTTIANQVRQMNKEKIKELSTTNNNSQGKKKEKDSAPLTVEKLFLEVDPNYGKDTPPQGIPVVDSSHVKVQVQVQDDVTEETNEVGLESPLQSQKIKLPTTNISSLSVLPSSAAPTIPTLHAVELPVVTLSPPPAVSPSTVATTTLPSVPITSDPSFPANGTNTNIESSEVTVPPGPVVVLNVPSINNKNNSSSSKIPRSSGIPTPSKGTKKEIEGKASTTTTSTSNTNSVKKKLTVLNEDMPPPNTNATVAVMATSSTSQSLPSSATNKLLSRTSAMMAHPTAAAPTTPTSVSSLKVPATSKTTNATTPRPRPVSMPLNSQTIATSSPSSRTPLLPPKKNSSSINTPLTANNKPSDTKPKLRKSVSSSSPSPASGGLVLPPPPPGKVVVGGGKRRTETTDSSIIK